MKKKNVEDDGKEKNSHKYQQLKQENGETLEDFQEDKMLGIFTENLLVLHALWQSDKKSKNSDNS